MDSLATVWEKAASAHLQLQSHSWPTPPAKGHSCQHLGPPQLGRWRLTWAVPLVPLTEAVL